MERWRQAEEAGLDALRRREKSREEVLRLALEIERGENAAVRSAFFASIRSYSKAIADVEAAVTVLGPSKRKP